ncbi:ferredoxin [Acidocella aquatica]|uniref:Ferredoxin n=1 Tax=Acidocella aquatica TaxID=1922313 RepID=A0ABQ6A5T8_9PROT|nr:Rieske 2Fe-2S domain-containing protein [Acidocella aquatica]GLR65489.1 ferredoxin [Acidocella aquatica]
MTKVTVALPPLDAGRSVIVEVAGQRVLICRTAGGLHAMDEQCPHQQLSMEGARVRHNSVMCPHHGARFSLEDGRSLSPLTAKGLKFFPCTEHGDHLGIEI